MPWFGNTLFEIADNGAGNTHSTMEEQQPEAKGSAATESDSTGIRHFDDFNDFLEFTLDTPNLDNQGTTRVSAIPAWGKKCGSEESTARGVVVVGAEDVATVESIARVAEDIETGATALDSNGGELGERRFSDAMSTAADVEKVDSGDCNASDVNW